MALTALLLVLGAVWGWFFWGWYSERQALVALELDPNDPGYAQTTPLFTSWPKQHLGRLGFVLDRVTAIDFHGRLATTVLFGGSSNEIAIKDVTPLARFTHLRCLKLDSTTARDLAPLAGLTQLQELDLMFTPVSDLAPLRGLANLRTLRIGCTGVTDLTPLARLPALRLVIMGPDATVPEAQANALRRALPACKVARLTMEF